MESLDLALRNLYTEFRESVLHRTDLEKGLRRESSYVRKQIKGKDYWYTQRYVEGKIKQQYIGPTHTKLLQKIDQERKKHQAIRRQIRDLKQSELRTAALLRRGGLPRLDSVVASLLERFSEAGLIDGAGVLVGSYAFMTYAAILGCSFEKSSLRTLDIDVVQDPAVEMVTSPDTIDLKRLLTLGDRSWVPLPTLNLKSLPFSFQGPDGLRVDFLTPLRGKERDSVALKKMPGVAAQPLRLLDFLILHPIRATLLSTRGGIAVTVPDPARFAIHKLMISARRPVAEATKKKKDLLQAAQLLEACLQECPEELKQAHREARRRGKKWELYLRRGLQGLPKDHPIFKIKL